MLVVAILFLILKAVNSDITLAAEKLDAIQQLKFIYQNLT